MLSTPAPRDLPLKYLVQLVLHLIGYYDSNHFHIILSKLFHSFSLKHTFPSLPLIHLPLSASLQSILVLQLMQKFHVDTFSTHEATHQPYLSLLLKLLCSCHYICSYFPVTIYKQCFVCDFFLEIASLTSSFHHHVYSTLILPLFIQPTSSHAPKTS